MKKILTVALSLSALTACGTELDESVADTASATDEQALGSCPPAISVFMNSPAPGWDSHNGRQWLYLETDALFPYCPYTASTGLVYWADSAADEECSLDAEGFFCHNADWTAFRYIECPDTVTPIAPETDSLIPAYSDGSRIVYDWPENFESFPEHFHWNFWQSSFAGNWLGCDYLGADYYWVYVH